MITFGKTDINTGLIPWKLDGQWIMDTPHSVWRCKDGDDIEYIIKRRNECIGTYSTLLEVANDLARLEADRLQEALK